MPTTVIKQVVFPLIDTTQPKPHFPDPYANIFFGGDSSGNLVIWRHETSTWDTPTQQEVLANVPNYFNEKLPTFFSKTDSSGNLVDYRFLGKIIHKIEKTDVLFYVNEDFTKEFNSYVITMNSPNSLLPNSHYLITR